MGRIESKELLVQKLFVRHQGQLRAFVLAVWPDFARADDVLQEAFLTVTAKAADFREGSNFLAWARAITQRKVYEAQRHARRPTMSPDLLDSLTAACPEGWAEDRRLAALAECLKSLPPRAQELVRLRYHKEHSPPEIATILGRTLNSVNVALAKARVALRDCVNRHLDPADLPAAGT
jgi:RNA polymerase sigma-70 factor (ECF subfamily)